MTLGQWIRPLGAGSLTRSIEIDGERQEMTDSCHCARAGMGSCLKHLTFGRASGGRSSFLFANDSYGYRSSVRYSGANSWDFFINSACSA